MYYFKFFVTMFCLGYLNVTMAQINNNRLSGNKLMAHLQSTPYIANHIIQEPSIKPIFPPEKIEIWVFKKNGTIEVNNKKLNIKWKLSYSGNELLLKQDNHECIYQVFFDSEMDLILDHVNKDKNYCPSYFLSKFEL